MGGTPPQAQEAARTFPCSHRRESSPRHLDLGLLSPEPGGGQISVVLSHPPLVTGSSRRRTRRHSAWDTGPLSLDFHPQVTKDRMGSSPKHTQD